jgi:menaquinone-dependent protoporphyrinogen oxidase
MTILVTAASRHGSTREIAETIATELRAQALAVEVRDPQTVTALDRYDAVILGSAVYAGKWLAAADGFARQHRARLATIPVWLFSSGPIGDGPHPHGDLAGLDELQATLGAREHVIFTGKLETSDLNLAERLIARVVHAPSGDFRDWDAIRRWARAIGTTLQRGAVAR